VKPRESLFSLQKLKKWQKIKKTPKISDLRHFFLLESYSFYGCHEMPIGKGFLGFGKKRSKNRKTLTPAPLYCQVPVQVQLQLSYKYSVINFEDKC